MFLKHSLHFQISQRGSLTKLKQCWGHFYSCWKMTSSTFLSRWRSCPKPLEFGVPVPKNIGPEISARFSLNRTPVALAFHWSISPPPKKKKKCHLKWKHPVRGPVLASCGPFISVLSSHGSSCRFFLLKLKSKFQKKSLGLVKGQSASSKKGESVGQSDGHWYSLSPKREIRPLGMLKHPRKACLRTTVFPHCWRGFVRRRRQN